MDNILICSNPVYTLLMFLHQHSYFNSIWYKCEMTGICFGLNMLTHWGRVTHISIGKLTIIGSDNGLSPGQLRNKLQWNFNRNSNIFIHENALENVICEMDSILSRPQCVNAYIYIFVIYQIISLSLSLYLMHKHDQQDCILPGCCSRQSMGSSQLSSCHPWAPYWFLPATWHPFTTQ